MTPIRLTLRGVLLSVSVLWTAMGHAGERCQALFEAAVPPFARSTALGARDVKSELVDLRLEVEQALAKGNTPVATVLEREFRQAYSRAQALSIDLSDFGRVLATARAQRQGRTAESEAAEERRRSHARSVEQSLQPWLPVARLPGAGLEGQLAASVAFSNDGTRVVTTGSLGVALLIDVRSKALIRQISGYARARFNRDGSRLLTDSLDEISLWDGQTGVPIQKLKFGPRVEVAKFDFFPDGQRIMGLSKAGALRIWESAQGTLVGSFKLSPAGETLVDAQVSADGSLLVTSWQTKKGSARFQNTWAVYDAHDGALLRHSNVGPVQEAFYRTARVDLSADGTTALTMIRRRHWALWEVDTGRLIAEKEQDTWASGFSRNGSRFAVLGSPSQDPNKGSFIRDAKTGAPLAEVSVSSIGLDSLDWIGEDRLLLTRSHADGIKLFDGRTGALRATLQQQLPAAKSWEYVVVGPNGDEVITVTNGDQIHLWKQSAPPP